MRGPPRPSSAASTASSTAVQEKAPMSGSPLPCSQVIPGEDPGGAAYLGHLSQGTRGLAGYSFHYRPSRGYFPQKGQGRLIPLAPAGGHEATPGIKVINGDIH